jgi:hypothetical protein
MGDDRDAADHSLQTVFARLAAAGQPSS